jgi:hypothetical protein
MPRKKRKKTDPEAQETTAAIDAESWGKLIEVPAGETVDQDWNGAPELQGIDETRSWDGDVVDAMVGPDADAQRASDTPTSEQTLEDMLFERLRVAVERLDDARAAGLGPLFEAAIHDADPGGERPVAGDDEMLGRLLARLDSALEQLETQTERSSGSR